MALGRKTRRLLGASLVLVGLAALGYAFLWLASRTTRGEKASGARLERIQRSPQWKGDRFLNRLPRVDGPPMRMMTSWFTEHSEHAIPAAPLEVLPRVAGDYQAPPSSGLRITWLGHSTLLLEQDGQRFLIDPVWSERASPFSFSGPLRWYAPPLPLEQVPNVDAVIISHDHYDHLDADTVRVLSKRGMRFVVPLGVGAHLESWGVALDNISELDWWDEVRIGASTLTSTPARHFSGRWIDDQGKTLWHGTAIRGPVHNTYYSGDTAMFDELIDIGEKLGPFDLTMIEAGAYNQLWADVHLGPEQAVRAHRLVRGKVLLPVHWGLFDLSLHGWTEPIERVLVAATKEDVRVLTPQPGQLLEPLSGETPKRWWPDVPWQTVEQAPAFSSHVDELLRKTAPGAWP